MYKVTIQYTVSGIVILMLVSSLLACAEGKLTPTLDYLERTLDYLKQTLRRLSKTVIDALW